ncbi:MAG: leucine-rich repeat domain-containing protein [Fimbriimonadaceae bacterium]|nr:leucine-rich repeat domain-containing protein [Fimbriimonadaceae bacterium]
MDGAVNRKGQKRRLILLNDSALRVNEALEAEQFELERRLQPVWEAILDPKTKTPFSVMFSGGWGTGKTSAMAWMDAFLKGKSKDAGVKVDTCWFHPWKYQEQEDVWKGLIAEVIIASVKFGDSNTEKALKAARRFGAFLGGAFVRTLGSLQLEAKVSDPSDSLGASATLDMKEALSGIMDEYSKHVTPQAAYFNAFEHALAEWIKLYYSEKNSRMVIFIDDLDRCLPNIALQVLEAIKLYLNIPNVVFIVGVDKLVIDAIVTKRYEDMVGEVRLKDGMEAKAKQYLDKMFQVEVHIPPSDHAVVKFVTAQLEGMPFWLELSEEHRGIVKDVLQGMAGLNPRAVVRAINSAIVGTGRQGAQDVESSDRSLLLAQGMQDALIRQVCSGLDTKKLCTEAGCETCPDPTELILHRSGRNFLRAWSRAVAGGGKSLYLVHRSSEVARTTPDEISEPVRHNQGTKKAGDKESTEAENRERHLDAVAKAHREYKPFLYVELLGYLARIQFPEEEGEEASVPRTRELTDEERLEILRPFLARSLQVAPSVITVDDAKRIMVLNLEFDEEVSDSILESFSFLSQLQTLHLSGTQVSNLSGLSFLSQLQTLHLSGTPVLDVSVLASLTQLQTLDLQDTPVSDVSALASLTRMENLNLSYTRVSDVSALASLTRLENLDLSYTRVSDVSALSTLTQLRKLDLSYTRVSDVSALSSLTLLNELYLHKTRFADVLALTSLTRLQWLNISETQVSDVTALSFLTQLIALSLSGTSVSDVSALSDLTQLRTLYLYGTQVTDLSALASLTELKELYLSHTQIDRLSLTDGYKALVKKGVIIHDIR